MILMLVGLMGATGVIQVWPHAKRLWSLVATWAFPVSDVKDPKEPFHDSSCTDEKTQDVGRLKAIGVFDRKPRIGTARRNRPGRNGVWQNWESASWVSTFASRIKKLSEFWGKVYLSPFWPPGFLSEYIDDVLDEVMGCGASATFGTWPGVVWANKNGFDGRWTNGLAVTGPCRRRRYSQRRCSNRGEFIWIQLQCQTWWMRGLFQSFTTFVDDSGFSTLQVVSFFSVFFLTFAYFSCAKTCTGEQLVKLASFQIAGPGLDVDDRMACRLTKIPCVQCVTAATARLFNILWSDPIEDGVNADPTTFGSDPQSHLTIMQNQFAGDP